MDSESTSSSPRIHVERVTSSPNAEPHVPLDIPEPQVIDGYDDPVDRYDDDHQGFASRFPAVDHGRRSIDDIDRSDYDLSELPPAHVPLPDDGVAHDDPAHDDPAHDDVVHDNWVEANEPHANEFDRDGLDDINSDQLHEDRAHHALDEQQLDDFDRDEPGFRSFDPDELPVQPGSVLELRQIAGLTAGTVMELTETTYDFAEGSNEVGFSITIDEHNRAIVSPGSVQIRIDAIEITVPTALGSAVLDVGSARFIVRPKRVDDETTDWLGLHQQLDQPDPLIEVSPNLVEAEAEPPRRRRLWRRGETAQPQPDVEAWELVEAVRRARTDVADRERFNHPDPTELSIRATQNAPILGLRPLGHPLFGTVNVLLADRRWMPNFDDIHAIPEAIGYQLQPLLSLPSAPVTADLLVGPMGVVGSKAATMACARNVLVSLFGISTENLHLHVATSPERLESWSWASEIAPNHDLDFDDGFSVVIVDGMENFGAGGFSHQDAMNRALGLVVLADTVEDLPPYCGTVLQIDPSGTALLTDHHGDAIAGTPIGLSIPTAAEIADQLVENFT